MRLRLAVGLALAAPLPAAAQCDVQQFLSTDFGAAGPFGLFDRFGRDVDVEGDLLAVGAPFSDVLDAADGGAVYVYEFDGTTFAPAQKLVHSDKVASDANGARVWIDGQSIYVLNSRGIQEWERVGANWFEHGAIADLGGGVAPFGGLGNMDIDGGRLIVGDPAAHDFVGEVRSYLRVDDSWVLEQTLANPIPFVEDFGAAVSLDGTRLAVTARGPVGGTGRTHLFAFDGSQWIQEDIVSAPGPQAELYGAQVALSGDTVAVSATHEDVFYPPNGQTYSAMGRVYTYTRQAGGDWVDEQVLTPADIGGHIMVGKSLALDGDVLVAGSNRAAPFVGSGDVVVWTRHGGAWHEDVEGTPGNLGFFDSYGASVDVQGNLLVGGADGHDEDPFDGVGTVWALTVDPVIDLGGGVPGVLGLTPNLALGALCPDSLFQVTLTTARANSAAALVLGFSPLDAPFKGGILAPTPDIVLAGLVTSPLGAIDLGITWPEGFPGITSYWQFAVVDPEAILGWSLSNGIRITSGGV